MTLHRASCQLRAARHSSLPIWLIPPAALTMCLQEGESGTGPTNGAPQEIAVVVESAPGEASHSSAAATSGGTPYSELTVGECYADWLAG